MDETIRLLIANVEDLHNRVDALAAEVEQLKAKRSKRFTPPTVEEVRAYCLEKGYRVNPQYFVDFYESKNWMVGKSKMHSWRAAVSRARLWENQSNGKRALSEKDKKSEAYFRGNI